ncbi:MAG: FeoB-associated Cys-rich membrane protein [Acutalibacteraceae bacterium]
MLAWLAENLGTIVISAVLLAIVAAIVIYLIRQKKQGKSTCGRWLRTLRKRGLLPSS